MNTALILANNDVGLYNFRKELIEALLKMGCQVIISLPKGERVANFLDMGCIYVETALSRHGMNPFQEIKLLRFYKSIIRKYKPDIVLTYTIKPNIYGGLAAANCKAPYIANVTGLGTAIEGGGAASKVLTSLYRRALRKAECVFFQNESNKDFMVKKGVTAKTIGLLPGSGVNLSRHPYEAYPDHGQACRFLFVGRLMRDKGVLELLGAAEALREKYPKVAFGLVGDCEEEFKETLEKTALPENVTLFGKQKDVHSYMKQADAILLPSYHEGMANVLLEAAACGRPVLASDIPGCRETFEEGVSGYGFRVRDVDSLVQAIEKFLSLSLQERQAMGLMGRRKVEKEFDRNIVVDAYMKIMQRL